MTTEPATLHKPAQAKMAAAIPTTVKLVTPACPAEAQIVVAISPQVDAVEVTAHQPLEDYVNCFSCNCGENCLPVT
jgi:hypothetical protein